MNSFRDILYAHLDGQAALEQVQRVLEESLRQQASQASAHGAFIEALYRGERLSGEAYHVLMQCVHAAQGPGSGGAAPVAPAGSDDRTIFRGARGNALAAPGSQAAPTGPVVSAGHAVPTGQVMPTDHAAPTGQAVPTGHAVPTGQAAPKGHAVPASQAVAQGRAVAPDTADDPDKTRFRMPKEPSSHTAPSIPPPSTPTTSRTTSTSWSDPSRWAAATGPIPGRGSVIRDRFVLEDPLGKGGMGTVFRARDLRKEEAQDRNPYVAIKILNEDFKRHPRSLQALQREARKSQTLAHPNIVTVYDFDRDGATVYMVMELLGGETLDALIRRHDGSGVGVEEAWRIGCEICTGMAYAHRNGFVHADFKPANAFLLATGAVKIIDFGIARAAKRGVAANGPLTVFDPGTLGALTPAYASCEVIDGAEPEASDDVYAISCVIYELLTGTHPFKRTPADVACSSNAVPAPPPGLSRSRWRALRRGLEFRRADRPASAAELLDSFTSKPYARWTVASAAAAGVAVLTVGALLIRGHVLDADQQSLTETLASAKSAQIEAVLPDLSDLPPGRRAAVLLDAKARAGLIAYFQVGIDAALDAQNSRYDYPRAEKLLAQLSAYLPDSQTVRDLTDHVTSRKNDEIRRQSDVLDSYIARGPLIDEQAAPNAMTVLAILRQIDPNSRLLHDPRLPGAFAQQTRAALAAGNPDLATALVNAGLEFDAKDPTLVDLRDRVRNARVTAHADGTVPPESMSDQQLRARFAAGLAAPGVSLTEAGSLAATIEDLAKRGAQDAPEMRRQLKIRLAQQIAVIRKQSGIDAAIRYAEGAYAMFPDSPVLKKTLIDVRVADAQRAAQKRESTVAEVRRHFDGLLDSGKVDDEWSAAVELDYKWLDSQLADDDPYMIQAKRKMAALYLGRATSLREAMRMSEAARMLDRARQLEADPAALAGEERLLAAARATSEAEARVREQAAQLAARKEKVLVQAQANQVNDALETLQSLRAELPKKDAFLEQEGPLVIARAYVRLASVAARDGRFEEALALAGRGRDLARSSREISDARQRYWTYRAIDGNVTRRVDIDTKGIRRTLEGLSKQAPEEVTAVTRHWVSVLLTRVQTASDLRTTERLTQAAHDLGEMEVDAVGAEAAAATLRDTRR